MIKKNVSMESGEPRCTKRRRRKYPCLKSKIIAASLAVAVFAASAFSAMAFGTTASITDGDNIYSVITLDSDADSILQKAGIICNDKDLVVSESITGKHIDIKVYRAFDVTITENGISNVYTFNMGTVEDALEEAGIELFEGDEIVPSLETELTENMNITVTHKSNVTVKADGETVECFVALGKGTVADALKSSSIEIGKDDIVTPAMDTIIDDYTEVTVKRVTYKDVTTKEDIAYETITKNSDELYVGETEVQTQGVPGEKTIVSKEKYVDGECVETKVISSEITKRPVSKVVLNGTKEKQSLNSGTVTDYNGSLSDASGNIISYSRKLTGTCTAYTWTAGSVTSTGVSVGVGKVAVNPNIIPYGTKLYIASPDGSVVYGYCVAADTGGAMMDGSVLVDVFYDSLYECQQFGRRTMDIYILD